MPQFRYNPRTTQMEPVRPEQDQPTSQQLFDKVKRIHSHLIQRQGINDDEIKEIINKVLRGTRNINYLVASQSDTARFRALREIGCTVLRETL